MRDIKQLHPILQQKISQLTSLCEKQGLKIGISECLRTVEEQNALYAKGRTAPGKIVTNARGDTFSSMHMWGVAFDIYRNDGTGAYNDSDGFFSKVGALGQSIGLIWGGAWKSIVDKPHFQLADWGDTTTILKKTYGTPENFFKTWKDIKIDNKEDDDIKYGKKLKDKRMIVVKDTYLRTSPVKALNKIKYNDLTFTLKKKCREDEKGYAIIEEDSTFIRIRSYIDENEDKWMQTKSGYWISAIYKGVRKVKEYF